MYLDKIRLYINYIIIGILSFIALAFLPFIGSEADIGWKIPNTFAGWVVWISTKIAVAILNVMIFHCFMQQAKQNIRDDEHYKEANTILLKIDPKSKKPRAPSRWNAEQYGIKGTTVAVFSLLSALTLTQAILMYDWITMLTYLFTIVMGLVFGVLQMKNAEDYWTTEYYQYALMYKEQIEEEEKKCLSLTEKCYET